MSRNHEVHWACPQQCWPWCLSKDLMTGLDKCFLFAPFFLSPDGHRSTPLGSLAGRSRVVDPWTDNVRFRGSLLRDRRLQRAHHRVVNLGRARSGKLIKIISLSENVERARWNWNHLAPGVNLRFPINHNNICPREKFKWICTGLISELL